MIKLHGLQSSIPEGSLPKEFILIHGGKTDSENGPYVFDEASAKSVMSKYKARGTEAMFDWHHASLSPAPVDPALAIKAAGWFVPEVRDGDLWATNCRWTEEAQAMADKKEIRYFSPAFDADKSGRVIDLINCALTNLPASHDNESLIAAARDLSKSTEESTMAAEESKYEETKKALEEERKMRKALEEENKKLAKKCKKLEAKDVEEEEEEEEETREEAAPPPHAEPDGDEGDEEEDEDLDETEERKHSVTSRSALNDEIVRLTRENAKLRGLSTTGDITTRVTHAIKKGIITASQKRWALSNPKAFTKLCSSFKGAQAPVQPVATSTGGPQIQTRRADGFTVELARQLGVDPTEVANHTPTSAPKNPFKA